MKVRRTRPYPSGWTPEGEVSNVTRTRVVVFITNRPPQSMKGHTCIAFAPKNLERVYHTEMEQDQKDAIVQAASSAAASLNTLQAKVPVSDTKNTAALANAYKAIGECQADYQG